ncbi:MAG: hypothetical protein COU85_01720 [Candidatus Portnoybacteria bacterium CG10_big_fil_rev_8_21_14_0_10_44_7]|uniref:Uncharacterized protein n=1 Tax=Candidatus Portnoybacteria bacterium CG10_big_fil_rev_8_21_14_0_10_44_7 TaxID=1974816 RepID=A0A2M8KIR3_9BACT|nr:MAG: hypothetical protein COU85_01720 [Candidatus Portnoybacteria bacterium CG10_big_fil_rev_8_21_14_0_10_44_7]
MKKNIFLSLIFASILTGTSLFARAETGADFDLLWSCPDSSLADADLEQGKALPGWGAEIVFVAQPTTRVDLEAYEFNWFVGRQKQADFSGPGRNFFVWPAPADQNAVLEVFVQIKKDGQIQQTETVTLATKKPEPLIYAGLSGAQTAFLFKKAITGRMYISPDRAYVLRALFYNQGKKLQPQINWVVGEQATGFVNEPNFNLNIPTPIGGGALPDYQLKIDFQLSPNQIINRQINLVWL